MSRFTRLLASSATLIFLAACGGNGSNYSSPTSPGTPSPNPPTASNVSVSIAGIKGASSFSPNPSNATVGQAVTWSNTDSTTHRIVADDSSFDTGNIAPGRASAAVMTSKAGTIPYHCSIHPEMVGTLIVK